MKIAAEVVVHAHYAVFEMAEAAMACDLFGHFLALIDRLRPREPVPC